MLKAIPLEPLSELDQGVYDLVVPPEHYLRKVKECIDFEQFRPRLLASYHPDLGRPPIDQVLMLKILFLCYHYHLSDRAVMARTTTDLAFRWFLGLGLKSALPDHTNGTHFRQRLGRDQALQQIFQDLVGQARAHGLVSDRLRLKDATHILADVADLRPIALVAQVREDLWQAAKPLFPDTVSEQQIRYEALQQSSAELPDDERLALRVNFLREAASLLQAQLAAGPATPDNGKARQRLHSALEIANKVLYDRDHPKEGDRLVSAKDSDARWGMHGTYYVGFMADVAMDAVSEIITAIYVLPANGAEGEDALNLIRQEEEAQGNRVEGLSMDGAGYNGPLLRELTDPQGLNLEVTVPPPAPRTRTTFAPDRFPLTVLADGTPVLTCPAGQTSGPGQAIPKKHTTLYRFKAKQCAACPLREQCLDHPEREHSRRTVQKNVYQAEYDKVAEKAKTPEYQETRRVHPKIERKLNELVRHHHCRRARYRGLAKVLVQALCTALVVNVKRIVKLMACRAPNVPAALMVRAEPVGG